MTWDTQVVCEKTTSSFKAYFGESHNFYGKKICGCFRPSYNCYKYMSHDSKMPVLNSKAIKSRDTVAGEISLRSTDKDRGMSR